MKVPWKEFEDKMLVQFWPQPVPFARLQKLIGRSKGSIISRARTLGLVFRRTMRKQASFFVGKQKGGGPGMPPMPLPKRKHRCPCEIFKTGTRRDSLQPGQCRFPIGDPLQASFRWCACAAVPGLPYCQAHLETCWAGKPRHPSAPSPDSEEKAVA